MYQHGSFLVGKTFDIRYTLKIDREQQEWVKKCTHVLSFLSDFFGNIPRGRFGGSRKRIQYLLSFRKHYTQTAEFRTRLSADMKDHPCNVRRYPRRHQQCDQQVHDAFLTRLFEKPGLSVGAKKLFLVFCRCVLKRECWSMIEWDKKRGLFSLSLAPPPPPPTNGRSHLSEPSPETNLFCMRYDSNLHTPFRYRADTQTDSHPSREKRKEMK